jgi:hypothetical protein
MRSRLNVVLSVLCAVAFATSSTLVFAKDETAKKPVKAGEKTDKKAKKEPAKKENKKAAVAPASGVKTVTLLEHLKAVGEAFCKVAINDECKKTLSAEDKEGMPADKETCLKQMAGSPDDAKTKINAELSAKCVESVAMVPSKECKKAGEGMTSGVCELEKLLVK